jgi:hypothetical protein
VQCRFRPHAHVAALRSLRRSRQSATGRQAFAAASASLVRRASSARIDRSARAAAAGAWGARVNTVIHMLVYSTDTRTASLAPDASAEPCRVTCASCGTRNPEQLLGLASAIRNHAWMMPPVS